MPDRRGDLRSGVSAGSETRAEHGTRAVTSRIKHKPDANAFRLMCRVAKVSPQVVNLCK